MRSIKWIAAVVPLLMSPFCGRSLGQESGRDISLHVTAVRSEEAHDWCTTGECSATRITVEGYSNTTEYVLDCVEVVAQKPSPHFADYCNRVHAHNDYDAKLFTDSIAFNLVKPQSSDGSPVSLYHIVSEKEISRKK
jgi:hypothetical protein